jgi:hypothetical protein
MRIYLAVEEDDAELAIRTVRDVLGSFQPYGCLSPEGVIHVEDQSGFVGCRGQNNYSDLPCPGDVVLVFGSAESPQIDASSGIFVLDAVSFLKSVSSQNNTFFSYAMKLATGGVVEESYDHYSRASAAPESIHSSSRFFVSSFPKSGSIWMMALISRILNVSSDRHLQLVHGADVELAYHSIGFRGGLAMVRDMRDVVVSWYHDALRSDEQSGFRYPRYPSISDFYREYFLGRILGNPQYYYGDMESWLNYLGARAIPLIRYEDLVEDTSSTMRHLLNVWKFHVGETKLNEAIAEMSFAKIQETLSSGTSYIAGRIKSGHVRKGSVGDWKKELPEPIAKDIQIRFSQYQLRLGYE